MKIQLNPITQDSIGTLKHYLPEFGNGDCNLSVAALLARSKERQAHYAVVNGALYIQWQPRATLPLMWQLPLGGTLDAEVCEALENTSREQGQPFCLYGVMSDVTAQMATMPQRTYLSVTSNAWWDYLYSRQTLADMLGRKLNGKRNFLRRFAAAHPQARFLPLSRETIPLCQSFLTQWLQKKENADSTLAFEREAIDLYFDQFEQLSLQGGVLVDGDDVLGFTFGSMVSRNTFAVHVEKALRDVPGAYPMLTQSLARALPDTVELLNREEDIGLLGLRKAKQDWAPVSQLQKGYATVLPLAGASS